MLSQCPICKKMIQLKSMSPEHRSEKMFSLQRQVKKRRNGEVISDKQLGVHICFPCLDRLKQSGWAEIPDGSIELVDGTTCEIDGVKYICENGEYSEL